MNEYTYLKIEIIWIPGHAEIEGNEIADTEAIRQRRTPLSQLCNYKPLKSARARYIKAAAKKQWQTAWSQVGTSNSIVRYAYNL